MPNVFKNDEQRKHWNEYANAYSKKNYKTICIKLNKTTDKDVIDLLDSLDSSPTKAIRILAQNFRK